MTRRLSGPKWLELRYLLLTFCFLTISEAAPLQETTEITEYKGCYYNFNQYSQGDRITTNEPCLNCTCHNDMLMCYLRVCPFTKPIGEDCTVEKREDQCCPIITCPEVPVELIDHHHEGGSSTDLAHPHRFGCTIDSKYFREGAQVPSDPRKPCELCYCIRNTTFCVMQECTLHVVGCQPIYNKGVCCPVRYVCDHDYDEDLLLEDLTTTTEKPTPGYILTTTISPNAPSECNHHGETYFEGALVPSDHACQHCYCMRGHVVCAVQECLEPLENRGKHCVAKPVKEGKCCPDEYDCEPSIIETTTAQIGEDTERPYGDGVTSLVEEKLPITIKSPTEEYVTEISEGGTTQASIAAEITTLSTESHKEIELVDESENEIHVDEKPGVPVIHRDQDDVTTSHYIEEKTESNIKETVISAEDEALQQHIDDRLQDEIEPPQKPLSHEQQTEKISIGDKTEKSDIVETQTVTAEEIDRVTTKVDESIEDEAQEGSGELSQTDETTVGVFHDDQIAEEITESVQEFTTKTKPIESLITEREGATPTEQPSGITEISEISAQTKKPYLDVHEKPHEESEEMVEKPIEIKEKPEEEEIKTESDELIISTTSSVKTDVTTQLPEENEFIPQVIPGEGDCLSSGITYNNNTIVPPMSVCELKCICFNSVVQCDFVKCPPPPIDRLNCETSYEEKDSCCPIYKCVTEPGVTATIASDEYQTTSATVESSEIPAIVEEIQTHEKIPTEVPAVVEETKLDEEVPAYVEEISITDDEDKLKETTTQKDTGYTEKEAGAEIEKIPSTVTDSEIITETESELEEVTPHEDIIASTAHKVESAAEDEGELSERTTIKYDHDEDITQKQEEAPEKVVTSKAESSTSMSVEEDFISPTSISSVEEIPSTTISGSEVSSRPTKISIPLLHDAEEGSGIIDEETSEHISLEPEQPGTTIKTPRPLNITDRLEKGDEGTEEPAGVAISVSTEKIDESTDRDSEYDAEISGITTEYVKITKEEEKTTEVSELIGIDQFKPTEKEVDEGKPEIEHDVEDKSTESSVKDHAVGITTILPPEDQHTEKPLVEISLEKIQEDEQATEIPEITHENKTTIVYDKEELDKGTAEVTTEFSQDNQQVQTTTTGEGASAVKEEDTLTETPDIDGKIRDQQEPTESTGIKQDKEETPIETTEIIEEGSGDITPSSHITEIDQDEEKPSAITEKLEDTYTEKIPAIVIPSIEDTTDIAKPEVQDQVKPITEIKETEPTKIEYEGEFTTKSKEEEYKEEVTTKSTEEEKIRVEKLPASTTDKELEEAKPTAFKESDEHEHDAYELPVVTEKPILIESMKPVHDETSESVETQDEGEKGTTEISKDNIDTDTEAEVTEKLPATTDQRKKDEEVHKPTEKEQEEKESIGLTTEKLLVEDYSTEKSEISEIIPTEAEPSVHIELEEEQLSETTEEVVEKSTETGELVKPIDEKPTKTDESTDIELATGKPTDITITTERDVSVTIKSTESILGEHEDQEQIGATASKPKEEHAYDTTESGEQLVQETPEGGKPLESTEIGQKEYEEQTPSITTETPIESVEAEEYDIQKPTETTDISQSGEYEEDKQSVTTESAEKEKIKETAPVTTVSQKDEIEELPAVSTDSPIKEHIEEGTESEVQQVVSTDSPIKEHIDVGTESEEQVVSTDSPIKEHIEEPIESEEQQIITTESAEKEKIKEIVSQKDETDEQQTLPTESPIKVHIEGGTESEEQDVSTESPIKEHIEEGTESEEQQVVSTGSPIKEHIDVGTESEEQVVSTESSIKEHIEEEGIESDEQQPLTTESAEKQKVKEAVSQKDVTDEQQALSTESPIKEHIEVGTESEEQQVVYTESPIKEHIEVETESEEQQIVSTESPIKEHIEVGTESEDQQVVSTESPIKEHIEEGAESEEQQPLTTESAETRLKETAPITTVSQKDEIEEQVVSTESPIKEHIEVGTESEEQQVVSTESPIKEHIEVGTKSEEQEVVFTESPIKEHIEVGTESEEQQVVSTESPIKEHIEEGTESEEQQVVPTESPIKEHIEEGAESEEQQLLTTESTETDKLKETAPITTVSQKDEIEEQQVVSTDLPIEEHIEVGTETEEQKVISTESPIKEHIEVGTETEEQKVISTESPIKEHIEEGTESEVQEVVSTESPIKEHIEEGAESEEQQPLTTESAETRFKETAPITTVSQKDEIEEQVVSTESPIKVHVEVGTELEEQQIVSTESPIKEHIEVGTESEDQQVVSTESPIKEHIEVGTESEDQQGVSTESPIKEHIEVGTESEEQQVVFTESPIKEHIEVGTESEEQVVSTESPIKEHIEEGIESDEQQPLTTEYAATKVKETAPIPTVSQKDEIEEQQVVSTESPIKEHIEEGTESEEQQIVSTGSPIKEHIEEAIESEEQQIVSTESPIKEHIEEGTESEEQQVLPTESSIKEHIEEGADSEEQVPLTTESAETDKLKETAPITTVSHKDEIEEQQVVSTDLPIKEHIEEGAESEEQQPLTTESAEKEKIEADQITTVSQKDEIEEQVVSTESTIKEHIEEGTESEEQQPITTESAEKEKIKETVTVSQIVETDEQQVMSTESPIKEHIEEGAESEEQQPFTTESAETDKFKETAPITTTSQKDEIDEEQVVSTESPIKEDIDGEAESKKPIEHGAAPSGEKEHIPYEEDKLGVTTSSEETNLEQTTVKEVPETVTHIDKETKPLDSYNLIESGESTATGPSITSGHKVEEEVVVTEIPKIVMDALDKKITKKPGEFTTDKVTVMPSALDDRISDEDSSATTKPDQMISPTESAEEKEKEKEETPIAVTTEKAITISPTVSHEEETTKTVDESIEAQKPIDIVSDVQKPIESDEEIEKEQYPIQEAFTPKPATTPPTHSTQYGGDTGYGQMPYPSSSYPEEEYIEEEEVPYGPGTCRYGGKLYVSAQQIPREDPCDFCFCFRSDIICLQQSCPPPISRCHEEPIQGFCCPRYECPVSMGTVMNVTTSTTTTTTTLPPHFLPHAYKGAASKRGCHIQGVSYQVGETVKATSGPCLHCICGRDGQMQCDPKVCTPEPMMRQMIAVAASRRR